MQNCRLEVNSIQPYLYHGNPSTAIYFAGGGVFGASRLGADIAQEVGKHETKLVTFTGSDPLYQNMRALSILMSNLRKMDNKRIVIETTGNRFIGMLLWYSKHWVLKPNKEFYKESTFKQYMKYGQYKPLESDKSTVDMTTSTKTMRYNWSKFVEIDFEVSSKEDMAFASEIFNSEIRERNYKTRIIRNRDYPIALFSEDWKKYRDTFYPYGFIYLVD